MALLPDDMAAEAGDWLRRSVELAAEATSKLELALLARCLVPADDAAETDQPADQPVDLATDTSATDLPEVLLACLLAGAPVGDAAALLAQLPLTTQGQVLALVATSTPIGIVRPLPAQQRGLLAACRQPTERWGVHAACDILRALPGQRQLRRALTATTEADADAAAIIQSHLFDMDDLTRLRTQELQLLLGRIDNVTLARALGGAGERVVAQIFANVSERRALLLRDELEPGAEVSDEEIEMACNEVMALVRKLYEHGDIVTYFGTISRAHEGRDDEEEEEDGDEAEDEYEDDEQTLAPAVDRERPGAAFRRALILIGTAVALTTVAILLLADTDKPAAGRRRMPDQEMSDPEMSDTESAEGKSGSRLPAATRSPGPLQAGEMLKAAGTADVILDFPNAGGARVAVAPGAQVEGLERTTEAGQDAEPARPEDAGLYLRVGRVTVTTVRGVFTVRTPLVEVVGSAGSIFAVRVVLDASTTATTRQGTVEVWSLTGRRLAQLRPGQRLRIDSSGRVELSP